MNRSEKPVNWTVGYHIRSADGVTLDFTLDAAVARKIAGQERAHIYEVTKAGGQSVRIS